MPEPLLTASAMFANAARFSDAYHAALSPLCAETGLPPAAADILLFLANNPGCETAGLRAEDLAHFRRCVAAFERNIERIRMENPKGTEM